MVYNRGTVIAVLQSEFISKNNPRNLITDYDNRGNIIISTEDLEPVSTTEITSIIGCTRETISNIMNELEEKGIVKNADPASGSKPNEWMPALSQNASEIIAEYYINQ